MRAITDRTMIHDGKRLPIRVTESCSIVQIFYTHFSDRTTFAVVYKNEDNIPFVNGLETDLSVDQITSNKTLINSCIKTECGILRNERYELTIKEIVTRINDRIEKEIKSHEQS